MRHIIVWVLLLGLVASCFHREAQAESSSAQVIEFQLPDATGRLHSADSLRGKVLYVELWASWCHVCKLSLNWLRGLEGRISSPNFRVVAVTIDEQPQAATAVINEFSLQQMMVLFDSKASLPEKYQMRATPTSFLIDAEGHIVKRFDGWNEREQKSIEEEIRNLLGAQTKKGRGI